MNGNGTAPKAGLLAHLAVVLGAGLAVLAMVTVLAVPAPGPGVAAAPTSSGQAPPPAPAAAKPPAHRAPTQATAPASVPAPAMAPAPPPPAPVLEPEVGAKAYRPSGLKVPRFVSLRSGKVNLRTGPGKTYPINWVFLRRNMPVEITAEYDTWRRIRDVGGSSGWVHQSMLSGRRTAVIIEKARTMRREPRTDAAGVARAEPGVIVAVRKCLNDWCEIDADSYRGWLAVTEMWGVYRGEVFD